MFGQKIHKTTPKLGQDNKNRPQNKHLGLVVWGFPKKIWGSGVTPGVAVWKQPNWVCKKTTGGLSGKKG